MTTSRFGPPEAMPSATAAVTEGIASGGPNLLVVKATYDPPPNTSPNWYRSAHER